MTYPIADNEAERLQALEQLGQLDSPAEERFDRLTRLAREHFDVPYALITMLDRERQWLKSCQGTTVSESPREMSFCNYAIMQDGVFTIPDMTKDQRFREHPLVKGPEQIRFYAGVPIHTSDGYRVGTLCLLDDQPRQLTSSQTQALRDFGALADSELQRQRLVQFEEKLVRSLDRDKARYAVDEGTRLWNREYILKVLEYSLTEPGQSLALARLSIDAPSQADAGAWNQFGQRIRRAIRPVDSVGRIDSNDFLLVLPHAVKEQLSTIARGVLKTVSTPTDKGAEDSIHWPTWLGLTTVNPGEKPEVALARGAAALARARGAEPFSFALAETEKVHGSTENHLLNFTVMLATLLNGGASYSSALQIVQSRLASEPFARILSDLEHSVVVEGLPLSQALQNHPDVFGAPYVATVELGENTDLGKALSRLFGQLFRDHIRHYQICAFSGALAAACQNAADMIEGGGSEARALWMAAKASDNEEVRLGFAALAQEVESGQPVAECQFPSHFPSLFSALLVARLHSGSLSSALSELAELLKQCELYAPAAPPLSPNQPPETLEIIREVRKFSACELDEVKRLENELARHVGPLAKVLVKKSLEGLHGPLESLPEVLAAHITEVKARQHFLNACKRQ